jgi:pilus assembly protein CpaF
MVARIANAAVSGMDGLIAGMASLAPRMALDALEQALCDVQVKLTAMQARRRLVQMFDLVIHLERPRTGVRRATHVADLAIEGDAVVSRDLFMFDRAAGAFVATGLRPNFLPRLEDAGLDKAFEIAF